MVRVSNASVACALSHMLIVPERGIEVLACGRGTEGQLGTGTLHDQRTPVCVAGLEAVIAVYTGLFHSAAVTSKGELFLWGQNYNGQLGLGDRVHRPLPVRLSQKALGGQPVAMVACGNFYTLVVTQGGQLFAFGSGACGQLGLGNKNASDVPVRVNPENFRGDPIANAAAGCEHSGVVTAGGLVYTWGAGRLGRLGHSSEQEELVPRRVEGQFGKAASLALGLRHTMVLTHDGTVWGYGGGEHGQLGVGDTTDRHAPVRVGGKETFGLSKVYVVECGYFHTMALTEDGGVWTWGCGEQGALGLGNRSNIMVPTPIGQERFGGAKIVAAVAGHTNSAAVSEDGCLFTWGQATFTVMSTGHTGGQYRLAPTQVPGDLLRGLRVGRGRLLEPLLALAFAMGTHPRLGAQSNVKALGVTEVVEMVIDFAGDRVEHSWP